MSGKKTLDEIATIYIIQSELDNAQKKFKPFNSAHEGYAVIKEELDELWDEVKKRNQNRQKMEKEAIQVATMALRFVLDVCGKETKRG